MKITKKLREQAAVLCAFKASQWSAGEFVSVHDIGTPRAAQLALDTRQHAWSRLGKSTPVVVYAEAEALLRTGFVPEGWS